MYSFKRTEGWYDGRPVAAGSTPSKPSSATFSASTKASITRTGLLSSTQSSRLSGNSVDCARSDPCNEALHQFPRRIIRRILATPAFLHSQGHLSPSQWVHSTGMTTAGQPAITDGLGRLEDLTNT